MGSHRGINEGWPFEKIWPEVMSFGHSKYLDLWPLSWKARLKEALKA
jgi:hypothetical protein